MWKVKEKLIGRQYVSYFSLQDPSSCCWQTFSCVCSTCIQFAFASNISNWTNKGLKSPWNDPRIAVKRSQMLQMHDASVDIMSSFTPDTTCLPVLFIPSFVSFFQNWTHDRRTRKMPNKNRDAYIWGRHMYYSFSVLIWEYL